MQPFVLRSLNHRLSRASTLTLVRLPGRVGRSAALWDIEAEGIADGYLISDKRGDELAVPVVFDATDSLHLLEDGSH